MKKRKHHIIPVSYLSNFTDNNNKLYQYLKETPQNPQYNYPKDFAYRRDYYSQVKPDGSIDYNSLEDFFSTIEGYWPQIIHKIYQKQKLNHKEETQLYEFIYLTKVRTPATRDSIEHFLASTVRHVGRKLVNNGKIPPLPSKLTFEDLHVAIDPHQSIHAMKNIAEGFSKLIGTINLKFYFNTTSIPLITSDNPIVYFNARCCENEMIPYEALSENLEFIFPIASDLYIHGHHKYKESDHLKSSKTKKVNTIKRLNRLIAKFAYERIFTKTNEHYPLIQKYSDKSPVLMTQSIGPIHISNYEFGHRKKLPKWKINKQET